MKRAPSRDSGCTKHVPDQALRGSLAVAYFEGKLPPKIQKGLAFDLGAGPIPGEMHLAAGQESAAVGSCAHLEASDSVWGTHRAHHFAIAKGVNLDRYDRRDIRQGHGARPRQGRSHAPVRPVGELRLHRIVAAAFRTQSAPGWRTGNSALERLRSPSSAKAHRTRVRFTNR